MRVCLRVCVCVRVLRVIASVAVLRFAGVAVLRFCFVYCAHPVRNFVAVNDADAKQLKRLVCICCYFTSVCVCVIYN